MRFIYRIFVCFFVLLASTFVKADDTPNWLQLGQESLVNGHYHEAENQFSHAEQQATTQKNTDKLIFCLLYTSPSPRD